MDKTSEEQIREDYRKQLQDYIKETQANYDSTIIKLSTGALAISIAFVNQIVGNHPIDKSYLLIVSWTCWLLSLGSMLISFYTSTLAFSQIVKQVDDGRSLSEKPGGWLDGLTGWLNAVSAILFFSGTVIMVFFASINL